MQDEEIIRLVSQAKDCISILNEELKLFVQCLLVSVVSRRLANIEDIRL